MCQKEIDLWLTSRRLGPRESLDDSLTFFSLPTCMSALALL